VARAPAGTDGLSPLGQEGNLKVALRALGRSGALILLAALVIRLAAALVLGDVVSGLSGSQDEISYSELGYRMATGHGLTFPRLWYPWILPNGPQSYYSASMSLFLAGIYASVGYHPIVARLIMGLLSTAVVGMIMLLAKRLFSTRVALVAGVIAAVYPYLVFYGVTLVTETIFILSILVAIYLAYQVRERPTPSLVVSLGLALAVAVLFRMAVFLFVGTLLVWIYWRQRRWWVLAVPVAMMALAVLPFTIRNYLLWGHFLLLESQFGHVLWNGNNPLQGGDFDPERVFPIPSSVLQSRNDAVITQQLLGMAIQNIVHDPGMFLALTVTRLREFFIFWPTPESGLVPNLLRVSSFGLMLPFLLIGLVSVRHRFRDFTLVFLFMVMHTLVYAVSWTMIRYRIPLDAVCIPFAAAGVLLVVDYVRANIGLRPVMGAVQRRDSASLQG
jgi:4-amino-4-deoxy-L-arabinose transferase-like glycosyltransferase